MEWLEAIVDKRELHILFLNTLSYLENEGAKKIAAYEHPTLVKEEILKHAAEEFRHAHYLKRQISRLTSNAPEGYRKDEILGGLKTRRYLDRLELFASKELKDAAYVLVTYVIELRAKAFYPHYETILRSRKIPLYMKSILLEEEEHLKEMEREIKKRPELNQLLEKMLQYEATLFEELIVAIKNSCSLL